MKNFRRLCLALVLTAAFSVPALADGGETQGPGAPAPGETHGPGLAAPGEMGTPGLAIILFAIKKALA